MPSGFIKAMRWLFGVLCALLVAGLIFAQDFVPTGSHLGVRLTPITADRASALRLGEPRGVEVQFVQPESPAAKAGIRVGDVLLTYNNEEILSPQQVGRLVAETPPGRKIKIQCWRERSEEHTSELQSRENLVCRL